MFFSRLAVVLLLPFLAAAFIPWLNDEATPRVVFVTFAWGVLLNVFALGVTMGSAILKADKTTTIKLLRITIIALMILWVSAIFSYVAYSPLVALITAVIAQLLGMQKFSKGDLWQAIPPAQQAFLKRVAWVSVGCQLMLALSVLRMQGGL